MVGLLSPSDYAGYADEGRRLAVDVPNVTPMDAARFIAEATPIIGDAMAAKEIYDEATSDNPNWAMVGALGGAAVLGLFPGIGDAAAKAVKSGARGLLDTAKRVEVDPNAMGSLLGNVRLKPKGEVGDVAKPTAAELRRQANIQRFGYDPSEASAPPSRAATEDAGFERYLKQVNPSGKRIAAEDRPNLAMGDMYGMLPKGSEVVGSSNGVTFHRGPDGNYYATAFNSDVGEEDVIGYITNRGDGTELAVVQEMQGKGVGGELQYLFRNENPNAPTGGLTEAGEASLSKTYQRLSQEGLLAPAKPAGIRAYHGSPHSFDKFSMDKIGTGEGAQAYGHGLYFAENEAVADSYKQSIRRNSEELRRIAEREGGLSGDAAEMLSYQFSMDDFHGKGFDKWLEDLKKSRDDGMLPMRSKKAIDEIINRSVEASDAVRVMKNPGSMYEVNINANPDDFLDWDAPLSAQSQSVQDAFVGINAGDDALLREILDTSPEGMMMQGMMPNAKGSAAYRTLMERGFEDGAVGLNLPAGNPMKPADKWASERLRKAGIPGIKYLDAGSRGTDAATRNFVVFDENLINIVKKYGIAGAATMLGVSAMDVEQAMAQGYQPSSQQPQGLLAQGAQ